MQVKNKKKAPWLPALCLAAGLLLVVLLVIFRPTEAAPQPTRPELPSRLPANPYSPADFALSEDGTVTCLTGQTVLGIDVSGFQGEIDWQQVKDSGVQFVFIRVGHRGTTEGGLYADEAAQAYYTGAVSAGLQVGAYFFSQAITSEEARQEAAFTLEQIAGWELSLPVVYDWEWVDDQSRTAQVDGQTLTECTLAFCRRIADGGYVPMIYFNTHQALERLEMEALADYDFWLAQYDGALDFPYQVDFWQYSCTGSVPGISGSVDMNLQFVFTQTP